ncbi:MAG: biotin/lipoyl-containing protein [Pyrinomonadaceae bacterium]
MKLVVTDHGTAHQLEFERDGHLVNALVDGRAYQVEVNPLPDGGVLLVHDGQVHECRVVPTAGNSVRVSSGAREFEFQVRDPRKLADANSADGGEGAAQLVAMMPGKIVRIMVEVGQEVNAQDAVLVVEAMKMQNELRSPRSGVVRELRVATGDTVNGGDILAVIE